MIFTDYILPFLRRRLICLTSTFCSTILAINTFAVPATSKPIVATQPDGSKITMYQYGDEHGAFRTNADGMVIKKNSQGMYVATKEHLSQRLKRFKKHAPQQMHIESSFPKTGDVRSVVLLVNFSDTKFTTEFAQQRFTRLLNEQGYSDDGSTGSARDYFIASSNGAFRPQFDVYGPFDLSHDVAYYGANTEKNGRINHSPKAAEMVREACTVAANNGVDFSLYDEDDNGTIDNVFIYYAGYNEAEGASEESVWPHRSRITNGPDYNGKQLNDYACTSELRGSGGNTVCGIGTFCHEFGHVLGLPDLYDVSDSERYTVGQWDIMANGSYNNEGRTPPSYSAFERFMQGWLQPVQLTQVDGYDCMPLTTSNTAYLIAADTFNYNPESPSPSEYFLIENRQRVGWDSTYNADLQAAERSGQLFGAIPGVGLLISHITFNIGYNTNNFNNQSVLGYDIVEAYNENAKSSSANDTYPGKADITAFIPKLNNDEQLLDQQINNITQLENGNVFFSYGVTEGSSLAFQPTSLRRFVSYYDKGLKDFEAQELNIIGTGITSDSITISVSNSYFEIEFDGQWIGAGNSITDAVNEDGTYNRTIRLRYMPTRQNCAIANGMVKVESSNRLLVNQMQLRGIAYRPIYITTPQFKPTDAVTPYSFTIEWEEQTDAEFYYLNIYYLTDEQSEKLQSFEDFDDPAAMQAHGWHSNFNTLSNTEYSDGKAGISFEQNGDRLLTETYTSPVSNISFWLSNSYKEKAEDGANGILLIEGRTIGTTDWKQIEKLNIRTMTKSANMKYDFTGNENYIQFRFTYTHLYSTGGAVIDKFNAVMPKTAQQLYGEESQLIPAPLCTYTVNGLNQGITYYYTLRCSEEKGCFINYSEMSDPEEVQLPAGTNDSRQFTLTRTSEDTFTAYFTFIPADNSQLIIYDIIGNRALEIPLTHESSKFSFSVGSLVKGNVYCAKYTADKFRSNDVWARFIY